MKLGTGTDTDTDTNTNTDTDTDTDSDNTFTDDYIRMTALNDVHLGEKLSLLDECQRMSLINY